MKKLRAWVTPITIGSFLLLGVTGLLMFFEVRGGLIVVAHEWLSPIFMVGSFLHIWLNWGAVRANLSRARGIIVVGVFGALLAFSIAPFEEADELAQEHGHGQEVIARRAAMVADLLPELGREWSGRCHTDVASIDGVLRCN